MTDPNRQNDDPANPAQAAEPVVSKPYIMPDDPEEGSVEALAKEAAESRDKMLRTLAEMENLRKRTSARSGRCAHLRHHRFRARRARYRRQSAARARRGAGRSQGRGRSRPEGADRRRRADRAIAAQHAGEERRQEIRSVGREIRSEFPAGDVRGAGCVGAGGHRGAGGAGRLHDRRARAAAGAGRRLQGRRQGRRRRPTATRPNSVCRAARLPAAGGRWIPASILRQRGWMPSRTARKRGNAFVPLRRAGRCR